MYSCLDYFDKMIKVMRWKKHQVNGEEKKVCIHKYMYIYHGMVFYD